MKGFVKVIIAGAIILGIGIAVLIIALAANGWKFNYTDIDFETAEFTSTEENTALDVTFNAGKLKIEYRDDDKEEIYISYPTAEEYETTITEKDGKISIENGYNNGKWFSGCNVSWGTWGINIPETVVKIPKDKITDISVKLNAGTVEIPDGEFEKVKIDVNAGTCNVGNITGLELLDIDLSAGTVNVTSVSGNELICHLSAGTANIKKADFNKTEVKVSAGSANLTLAGAKSDYTASVDVSAGSCNGISTQSGGDKNIKVKVSAGSCNVSFAG